MDEQARHAYKLVFSAGIAACVVLWVPYYLYVNQACPRTLDMSHELIIPKRSQVFQKSEASQWPSIAAVTNETLWSEGKFLYVYDIPRELAGPECAYCGRGAGRADPGYMVESEAHKALRASRWATRDQNAARWYVVPLLYSCAIVCRNAGTGKCGAERRGADYVQSVFEWLQRQPRWQTHAHRHVFVFSHDRGAYSIAEHRPELFNELRRGLFVQTAGAIMPGRPLAFDPSWDLVLPSASDHALVPVPTTAREARARRHLVFWQGGVTPPHKFPVRALWDRHYHASGAAHSQRPDVVVRGGKGGSARDRASLEAELRNATFCLYLPGAPPQRWSSSLGHMIASGCLLVVADDASTRPFEGTLPWDEFALRVPERSPRALAAQVNSLPNSRLEHLLRKYREVRPFLLYHQRAAEHIAWGLLRRDVANYAGRSERHLGACLAALGPSRFGVDADADEMSAEQKAACTRHPE